MKQFQMILVLVAFFTLGTTLYSCGGESSDTTNTEQQGKEYTSAYVCPMHCEGSGADEPGKCPVCGMDYVLNEDHMKDGHEHEDHSHEGEGHEGHDH